MKLLVKNIRCLAGVEYSPKPRLQGKEMAEVGTIDNAWLLVEDGRVAGFGTRLTACRIPTASTTSSMQRAAWCCRRGATPTRIVYAGSREREFVDKINGLSYEEIARRGGGILNSADLLHSTTEDELFSQAMRRLDEVIRKGTGCIEIKSGYGLNLEGRTEDAPCDTAHEGSVAGKDSIDIPRCTCRSPRHDTKADYVKLIINEMIPEVGRQRLADFVDVFCDRGFFTPEETASILDAAAALGHAPEDSCR